MKTCPHSCNPGRGGAVVSEDASLLVLRALWPASSDHANVLSFEGMATTHYLFSTAADAVKAPIVSKEVASCQGSWIPWTRFLGVHLLIANPGANLMSGSGIVRMTGGAFAGCLHRSCLRFHLASVRLARLGGLWVRAQVTRPTACARQARPARGVLPRMLLNFAVCIWPWALHTCVMCLLLDVIALQTAACIREGASVG